MSIDSLIKLLTDSGYTHEKNKFKSEVYTGYEYISYTNNNNNYIIKVIAAFSSKIVLIIDNNNNTTYNIDEFIDILKKENRIKKIKQLKEIAYKKSRWYNIILNLFKK